MQPAMLRYFSLSLVLLVSAARAADPPAVVRILLVHSFGRDFAPFTQVAETFRADLSRDSPRPVEFLETSLEMARFGGLGGDGPLVDYLAAVWSGEKPDLVVPFGAPALMFVQRNRDRLFQDVPILAAGVDKRRIDGLADDPLIVSAHFELDLPAIANDIRRLLPEMRHLHVVFGTAPLERFWEQQLREEWPGLLPGVELHWLSGLSLLEIKSLLADLPADSAVFFGIMSRDAAGIHHENENALAAVRRASAAPVFGYAREQIGLGIVGGPLISLRDCGAVAAGVARRLIAGQSPASIDLVPLRPGAPTYDWRELRHWQIPASRLPAGNIILHTPPGLWEAHRTEVLAGGGLLLLQTLLIGSLLVARSRQRAAEAERGLSESRFSRVFYGSPVSISIIQQADRRIVDVNPAWEETCQVAREVAVGRTHAELGIEFPGESGERFLNALATGSRLRDFDLAARLPDGRRRQLAVSTELLDLHGAPCHVSMAKDVTDQHEIDEARQRIGRASRLGMLGELSASIAHEVNQPLASILSNAEAAALLMENDHPPLDQIRAILSDIRHENLRAGQVIRQVRSMVARKSPGPFPLDPGELAASVARLVSPDCKRRAIAFRIQIADDLPRVGGRRVQLEQVLLNLLLNAMEAVMVRPHGQRSIHFIVDPAPGETVGFAVVDTGTGIPEENLDRIFDTFFSTKDDGMGLGLALSRSIAESHGGRICATNTPAGGARFDLFLPQSQ